MLNDLVSVPSSSELAAIGRGERSPSATAFVPSASNSRGCAKSVAKRNALTIAAKIANSSVSVSVIR